MPKLEKMISERDAQIDFLTKNVSSMEVEISRLKVEKSEKINEDMQFLMTLSRSLTIV